MTVYSTIVITYTAVISLCSINQSFYIVVTDGPTTLSPASDRGGSVLNPIR